MCITIVDIKDAIRRNRWFAVGLRSWESGSVTAGVHGLSNAEKRTPGIGARVCVRVGRFDEKLESFVLISIRLRKHQLVLQLADY